MYVLSKCMANSLTKITGLNQSVWDNLSKVQEHIQLELPKTQSN